MEKIIVLFCTICLQVVLIQAKMPDWLPAEVLTMAADDKKRCMAEHGVDQNATGQSCDCDTDTTIHDAIDRANDGEMVDDRSLKCYMHCMMDAFSMVNEDGGFETEMMIGFMPEAIQARAREAYGPCSNGDGADNCEKIYSIAKCCYKNAPDLWFVP